MRKVLLTCVIVLLALGGASACRGKTKTTDHGNGDRSTSTSPSPVPSGQLTIAPESAKFPIKVQQCFTATGGNDTYQWWLTVGDGGPVEAGKTSRACFISSTPVKFTMMVQSAGKSATAMGEVTP